MKRILLIFRMRLVLSFLFLFLVFHGHSQQILNTAPLHQHDEKCAATFIEQKQTESMGIYGSQEYFETWMQGELKKLKEAPQLRTAQDDIRTIPVVIHVIHDGTAVGDGANIPRSQIEAQIRSLNEDFRRTNPDAGDTPAEFQGVAADSRIEFVLAQEDPDGLPTTGINRVQGPAESYAPQDASLISSLALWPPEEYLNIWVVRLSAPNIGYASFPISDLPGLNFPPTTRELDGVTVDYRYFGEGGNALGTARGRTLTHEVGHFLGLRHIWGDPPGGTNGCDVDDFVADTPNQQRANTSCTTAEIFTCDSRDMIQNYMDYTPDRCMNLFTQGQVERMWVVLANSPRRVSLVNNRATTPPADLPSFSLVIRRLIQPSNFICETPLNPQIEVQNVGETTITSVRVEVRVNGGATYRQTVSTNLPTGDRATLTFNPVDLNESSDNTFELEIIEINAQDADVNASTNLVSSEPILQDGLPLPYTYSPGDFESTWTVRNDDSGFTWESRVLNISGVSQEVVFIRSFEYERIGAQDFFISPPIDLSNTPSAQMTFDLAYAPYPQEGLEDRLWIAVSTDCGNTFDLFNAPYRKEGVELQTTDPDQNEFVPNSEDQFRKEILNLSAYEGEPNVRIAFVSLNGYGNNIYVKNISITSTEEFEYNLRLNRLLSPGPVIDGSQENQVLEVSNIGNLPISSFILSRQVNNGGVQSFIAQGEAVPAGETAQINLPASNFGNGTNRLNLEISRPNFDQNEGNTSRLTRFIVQSPDTVRAPWRKDFNQGPLAPWVVINPENNLGTWRFFSLSTGNGPERVMELSSMVEGNSYWLASPKFDLSRTGAASVFFDKAHSHQGGNARFRVLVTNDGGTTYNEVLSQVGAEIASIESSGGVNPNSPEDWRREFVDLSAFAGSGNDNVRVAFVVDQATSTTAPVYVDNMELFFTNTPEPVIPEQGTSVMYPNPAVDVFSIGFNFDEFEDVNIQILNLSGMVLHDVDYPNTLNQTYTFSTQMFSKGVFIVKIRSQSITDTKRLLIQ
ncbi:choice-of-anchor J domain-containing protein [Litoribacter ruber]|uniref:Choice-of-anchor J domain-containing protein n=1 Tax=Litoribacter ruber TaxID=702568 RepID=A0AAP2G3Q1_9BACT|nr:MULTISPECIES: M43 family zinc metalloprotease [Litoribacter]MBS9523236.1 choice-of-anchor J domain-containing protein [Litoribacter alkaliphilus]MBT0810601.1 choice-of-anchor J domain-containing protein [Litoribacter ruber]